MKFVTVLVAGFLPLAGNLRADLTITQKVEGVPGVDQMVLQVKGDQARVDATPEATTIIDSKTGAISTLLHEKREVMRISPARAKAMAEMARQFSGEKPAAAKPKLVPTGRKETISGYPCEEYRLEGGSLKASFWITTKNSDYQAILDQLAKMQSSVWNIAKEGMPDYRDLPGLAVRVMVEVPEKGRITNTIISINQDPISPERFAIPAGYHTMEMPDFPKIQKPNVPAQKEP